MVSCKALLELAGLELLRQGNFLKDVVDKLATISVASQVHNVQFPVLIFNKFLKFMFLVEPWRSSGFGKHTEVCVYGKVLRVYKLREMDRY